MIHAHSANVSDKQGRLRRWCIPFATSSERAPMFSNSENKSPPRMNSMTCHDTTERVRLVVIEYLTRRR
jgi:hypothetical protein